MEKMSKLKKDKKICLDETMVKKPKLKHSSSLQLLSKDFPKLFSECAMFIRERRNTKLTKNITLDNAGVLDPLLKFIFKNWDVTQFIILLILKKITSNYYPFPQLSSFLVIICFVILIFSIFFSYDFFFGVRLT